MIEKISPYDDGTHIVGQFNNYEMGEKINKLVDAVNELQEKQNAYWTDVAELKKQNLFAKSMVMDKEFAEAEMERLQKKLNGITEQLKIAVDALKEIIDWDKCVALQANDFVDIAEKAIQKIQKEAEK